MTRTVRIALIGAGRMAHEHCRVFSSLPNATLAGVYSRPMAQAESFASAHGIPIVCESVESLWRSTKADLVLVTVNVLDMFPVVAECADYDWAIFMEKPPGHDFDASTSLRQCVTRKARRAFVGLNRRFYSAVAEAKRELADSGGPRYIAVCDRQSFAESRAAGHPEAVVKKMMYANSIHMVDYLRIFGRGEISQVQRMRNWEGEYTFLHSASVYFSSGDIGRYDALWNGPGPWSCTISCAEKRLEMRPLESLAIQQRNQRDVTAVDLHPIDAQFKPGLYRQAEELLRAVRHQPNEMTTVNDAYEVMSLIHDIYGV